MVEHQYLALREKLKEAYRLKIRRQNGDENTRDEIMSLGKDHYNGSFFGSSVTILAPRLITEKIMSLAENLSSNKSFCSNINNKDSKTAKIQRIKESRDYSFLENQELKPVPVNNGQELDSEKWVLVGKSVASTGLKKQETLKKENMPKGLPSKTIISNVESKAKTMMQQRKKSEAESITRLKHTEATAPKLVDVKKMDHKQSLSRNSENRPVKKGVDQKQPFCRNLKKRALEDGCSEDEKAFNELRQMFNTQRFAGRDDSDRVMEVSFRDIVKEEKRSERLGKKEDEEQLRLIQEEEKRRQMAKRRKR